MSREIGSWFHSTPSTRPLDNNDAPSKILRIVLAILGIIASFVFFTAALVIIATLVIFGVTYFSLQRINNVYYRTVSPRPLYQRIFPFWPSREESTRSFWTRSTRPTSNRWFWQTRAPVGTGRSSPIWTAPPAERSTRRVFFGASTTRREDPPRGFFHREPTRSRVGDRR